jgi:bacterioferritin-associated ferredoxin
LYVCLCKALTESEVVSRARACISEGITCSSQVLRALDLEGDEACGFCTENPEHILAIFEDELELHGYSRSPEQAALPNS